MRWHDWVLLACSAALVLIGPAMALQELAKAEDARRQLDIVGIVTPLDPSYRVVWLVPLTFLTIAVGLVGTFVLVRTLADPGVRVVAGRLVALLIAGMTLLDVVYYADGFVLVDMPYAVRAATTVWLYPLAGILVAGSTFRLAELHDHFGTVRARDRDAEFRV